jgi:hypothetical protein
LGGVSDYTALVAAGLAERGAAVHVWTGAREGPAPEAAGVKVHCLAGLWGAAGLGKLNEELSRWPAPRLLLTQYAPNAYGRKGLNFTFCNWLLERRELGDEVRLMVHEPFYPWRLRDKPTRWLLAAGQRRMMRKLLAASSQVDVVIPAWAEMIRPFDPQTGRDMAWAPACSNIRVQAQPAQVDALRHWFAPRGEFLVGGFSVFGGASGAATESIFASLLAWRKDAVALLIGKDGERLAARLMRRFPAVASRVRASGALLAEDVSCHLMACDVLIQPYPDGISTRRTSALAGLAHGRPVVTMAGPLTEDWWAESGAARLLGAGDWDGCAGAVAELLDKPQERQALGQRGQEMYEAHLSLAQVVNRLLGE